MTRSRLGAGLVALAAIGLAVALYLLGTRLAGGLPVCGPIHGCEDVARSEYSTVLGLPVALYGVGFSLVLLGATWRWWRTGDRRALLVAYGLGLVGVFAVGYLTYLELFVIRAVCVWCVAYAATVLAGWLGAAIALRGASA